MLACDQPTPHRVTGRCLFVQPAMYGSDHHQALLLEHGHVVRVWRLEPKHGGTAGPLEVNEVAEFVERLARSEHADVVQVATHGPGFAVKRRLESRGKAQLLHYSPATADPRPFVDAVRAGWKPRPKDDLL